VLFQVNVSSVLGHCQFGGREGIWSEEECECLYIGTGDLTGSLKHRRRGGFEVGGTKSSTKLQKFFFTMPPTVGAQHKIGDTLEIGGTHKIERSAVEKLKLKIT